MGALPLPVSELLPIVVADLADDSARDFLCDVAGAGGETWVPLVAAPVQRQRHLLEVYTPGYDDPLRFLAEPLGPPGEHGFPLRLFPYDEREADLPAAADERTIVETVAPQARVDTPTAM